MAWVSGKFAETDRTAGQEPIVIPELQEGQKFNPDQDGKLGAGFWAANKGVPPHILAGVCVLGKFSAHSVHTEDEFDAAVKAFHEIRIGGK